MILLVRFFLLTLSVGLDNLIIILAILVILDTSSPFPAR